MALTLFRRHLKTCPASDRYTGKDKIKLKASDRRHYNCGVCPIWICGTTATTRLPRQSTGYTDMKSAEAVRAKYATEGKDEQANGPRLEWCISEHIRSVAASERVKGQYRFALDAMREYMAKHDVHFAQDMTVDLLERFKVDALPGEADTTKQTYWNKVVAFLNEAFRRGWILEPLGDKVRPFDAEYEEKSPFEDGEVEKILAEALKLNGGTTGYAAHPKTFRLLLDLMLETGMRVSDAVAFNPAAVTKGAHTWIYKFKMTKRRKKGPPKIVTTYLTDKLKKAIDACHWMSPKLPFSYGTQPENACYERMQAIGSRCDVADCRPHRLRDTFAVRKLLAGFSLDDVKNLLGHSSVRVTETYYAKWTDARALDLERRVAQSSKHPVNH